ncbi:MAG: MarR family transcriptional regulator [Gelidibacter sp.]
MNIGLTMGDVVKGVGAKLTKAFAKADKSLPMDSYIILNALYEKEDLIQNDLADILHQDKSGVLRKIDYLQGKRLIARIPSTEDRRRNLIVLTQKGVQTVETMRAIEAQVFNDLLHDISKEDLQTFHKVLINMKSNLN